MSGPARGTPIVWARAKPVPVELNVNVPWWSGGQHGVSVLIDPPEFEPLTLEEAKLRAGFVWVAGDERDALLRSFISAARAKVEMDTGLALPEQTRDVRFDYLATDEPILLPGVCAPLQQVLEAYTIAADGTAIPLDPAGYVIDSMSNPARVLITSAVAGTSMTFQPFGLKIVAGWKTAAEIPPLLVHAVGLLATHYLTLGRDIMALGTIATELPLGYEHVISGYRPARIS